MTQVSNGAFNDVCYLHRIIHNFFSVLIPLILYFTLSPPNIQSFCRNSHFFPLPYLHAHQYLWSVLTPILFWPLKAEATFCSSHQSLCHCINLILIVTPFFKTTKQVWDMNLHSLSYLQSDPSFLCYRTAHENVVNSCIILYFTPLITFWNAPHILS